MRYVYADGRGRFQDDPAHIHRDEGLLQNNHV